MATSQPKKMNILTKATVVGVATGSLVWGVFEVGKHTFWSGDPVKNRQEKIGECQAVLGESAVQVSVIPPECTLFGEAFLPNYAEGTFRQLPASEFPNYVEVDPYEVSIEDAQGAISAMIGGVAFLLTLAGGSANEAERRRNKDNVASNAQIAAQLPDII